MKSEVIAIRKEVPHFKNILGSRVFGRESDDYFFTLTVATDNCFANLQVIPNTLYTVYMEHDGEIGIYNEGGTVAIQAYTAQTTFVFNSGNNSIVRLYALNRSGGVKTFKNWVVTMGEKQNLYFLPLSDTRIKERLKDNGSVKEVRIRFYPGVERTLKVRPYVLHKAGRAEDFFTYPSGTEPYITGNDDQLIFPVLIDFEYDDEIVVDFENVGDYPYTLSVDIIVSYYREELLPQA